MPQHLAAMKWTQLFFWGLQITINVQALMHYGGSDVATRHDNYCPHEPPRSGSNCGAIEDCSYRYRSCPDGSGDYTTVAHCLDGRWAIIDHKVICEHSATLEMEPSKEEPEVVVEHTLHPRHIRDRNSAFRSHWSTTAGLALVLVTIRELHDHTFS
mmetsp:Transcript_81378/g.157164  ORF Transcript_81378/g.157164 Transcript_81378/m.157164 type:complete len:156 (+) Transcript_81378:84-551(+)